MNIAQGTIPILESLEAKSSEEGFGLVTEIGPYVAKFITAALQIAGVATIIYMIIGGIYWITSSGDKNNIEEARNRITNGIIGLGIVASAWAIFLLADYFFGLNLVE